MAESSPANRKGKTAWERFEMFPPILVRLLARHPRGEPLSEDEILSVMNSEGRSNRYRLHIISDSTTWNGIELYEAMAFLKGCNLDFISDRKTFVRARQYLRQVAKGNNNFEYLRKSNDWLTLYQPLIAKYAASMNHKP